MASNLSILEQVLKRPSYPGASRYMYEIKKVGVDDASTKTVENALLKKSISISIDLEEVLGGYKIRCRKIMKRE